MTGFVLSALAGSLDMERQSAAEQQRVVRELAIIRARVEGLIQATFNSTDGLVHLISIQGGISESLFGEMAERAIGKNAFVRNISVAPDNTVTMVFPRHGNEKVLGFHFASNPEQFRTVQAARERQAPILAGPLTLIQGTRALVQRAPAFVRKTGESEPRYWGAISIVAYSDKLLSSATEQSGQSLRLAIRGKDGLGEKGELVDGDDTVFSRQPILMDLNVPGGKWQLAGIPSDGWSPNHFYRSHLFHLGLAITALLSWLVALRRRHDQQLMLRQVALQQAEVARREEEERFRTLFESSPDPAWIIEENQFVRSNHAARVVFGDQAQESGYFNDPARLSPPRQPDGQESHAKAKAMMLQARQKGSHRFEWVHLRHDGTPFFAEVTLSLLRRDGKEMLHAVVRDISQRKMAEAALEESRHLQQTLIESAGAIIYIFDRNDRLILCNQLLEQTFGKSKEELLGRKREEYMPADLAAIHTANDHSVIASGKRASFEETINNGKQIRTYLTVKCPIFEGSHVCGVVGISTDITERKADEEALRLYANMFEQSNEAILITDADNRIVRVNPALERATGYTADELIGQKPHMLASGQTSKETYRDLWQSVLKKGYWHGELWDRRKDGGIYPKWTTISAIRDPQGRITNYLGLFTDISERKQAEEQIHHLAHHDKLTGLFNRHSLHDRLGQALALAQRNESQLAVLFLDMDRFKNINDTLGHHSGDHLLIEVARRLQGCVRNSDIVARLGGDEFVIVLTGIQATSDVFPLTSHICEVLGSPYQINGKQLHTTPSIGISLYPQDGDNAEVLMQNADAAMYHAKAQGRNNFQFFTAELNASAAERLELEQDLRAALAAQTLEVHYQLQVHAHSQRPCGTEALLRWPHPQRGMISPLKFIPIAEESGLIEPLGNWVLEQACRQVATWRDEGLPPLRMAVNLSPHQLRSPTLLKTVRETMERYAIQSGELELEITESAAMQDPQLAIEKLRALRELGISLAIDDFGTGYSSLAYLKKFPVDILKIDRSFVKDIEVDDNDATICSSILALAHSLGLHVVAEGVETTQQQDFLSTRSCDYLQGYLFAKPVPAAECRRLLVSMYDKT